MARIIRPWPTRNGSGVIKTAKQKRRPAAPGCSSCQPSRAEQAMPVRFRQETTLHDLAEAVAQADNRYHLEAPPEDGRPALSHMGPEGRPVCRRTIRSSPPAPIRSTNTASVRHESPCSSANGVHTGKDRCGCRRSGCCVSETRSCGQHAGSLRDRHRRPSMDAPGGGPILAGLDPGLGNGDAVPWTTERRLIGIRSTGTGAAKTLPAPGESCDSMYGKSAANGRSGHRPGRCFRLSGSPPGP